MCGEPALEVGRAPLPSSAASPRRRSRRSAADSSAPPRPEVRAVAASSMNSGRSPSHGLGPVGHQPDAVAGELGVPCVERGGPGGAGPDPRDQSVPLREGARVARCASPPARPQGGDHLVEVGPPAAGAPFTSSSRSGRKTLDQRARLHGGHAVHGAVVNAQVLRLAGLEADLDPVVAIVAGQVEHARAPPPRRPAAPARARSRCAATAPCSRSTPPPAGSSCRRRSARDHREPVRKPHLRRLVVAEVAQLDALDAARPPPTRSGGWA